MIVLLHVPKLSNLLLGKKKYYHLFPFLLNSTLYEYKYHTHFMEKSNEIPKILLFSYVPGNFRVNFSI